MRNKGNRRKLARPKAKLSLPDLDQAKTAVLATLRSPESQRGYQHSMEEFIACARQHLARGPFSALFRIQDKNTTLGELAPRRA